MLASPLDEEFLVRSQGAVGEPRLVALLEGEPPRIVASSNAAALPPGDSVAAVEGRYLLTGKSFFDLASSDLVMMFASFIPTAEVDALMASILAEGRKGRAITAAALILVSMLIVFGITLRTRRLSRGIEEFSHRVLGSTAGGRRGGDEIQLIESRFRTMTTEVVEARERLRREAEEKLALQAKALAAEQQEQELRLLQELRVSEEKYHALFDSANDAIFLFDVASGEVLDANRKAEQLLGRGRETILGRHYAGMHPKEQEEACRAIFEEAVRSGGTISTDVCILRADGHSVPVEISTSVLERDGSRIALGIFRDISERRHAQRELEEERNRAQMYLDIAAVIILVIGADGRVRLINRAGSRILGYPEEEIVGEPMFERFIPERLRAEARDTHRRLLAGEEAALAHFEFPVLTSSGGERIVAWHNAVVRDAAGAAVASLSSGEDVTEQRRVEGQARTRSRHLEALHSIDLIISSSLDLHVTLEEFLGHVIAQLGVDAADVLLLDPYSQTLEYAAGSGFRSDVIKGSRLRLGEGVAGTAALERRGVSIPDLAAAEGSPLSGPLLEAEGFAAYYAMPLTAKGRVQGVLEVLHRAPLVLDEEQAGFLEALASQAAIAIDNASLFDRLQRSNTDLTLAYDATLEGWARALDLRDRVTERHTERVTAMTVRLAREMGMREEEIVHVRRGALLHDIGKIGIPDSILNKPGPLTPEEWETMRRHPRLAFEMLQPIAYLRPALDIPYCHHEHWDGSGYPRGLRGEQIPLGARIFALADVWDALHDAERPYRTPLSSAEACEQVRTLAGTHLDPKVVEAFLRLKDEFCRPEPPAPEASA